MKLKIFDSRTQRVVLDVSPKLSITLKNGVIAISVGLRQLMDLQPGQKLSLAQDEQRPQDWYIYRDNESGMEVRVKQNNQLLISNRICAHEIAAALDQVHARRIVVKVGQHPIESEGRILYPLITKGAIVK